AAENVRPAVREAVPARRRRPRAFRAHQPRRIRPAGRQGGTDSMSIHVIKPGALSTLQDLGRLGYQRFGVAVNGAMDERSHRMANFLVGNPGAWPTLEITLTGPRLRFDVDVTIAISGADISPMLDGLPVDTGEAVLAERGSVLSFGERVY